MASFDAQAQGQHDTDEPSDRLADGVDSVELASVSNRPSRPDDEPTPIVVHLAGLTVLVSVVAIDPSGWYPFVVAKWSAVALSIVAAWTAGGLTNRSRLPRPARLAFAALIAILVLAAVFGREQLYAWVGTPERQLGVFTWLLFAAALVTGAALDTADRRRTFSRWVVVALGCCVAYGAAEFVDWNLVATDANTSRLLGPYGSASFFGAALCLLVPVAFGLAADDEAGERWQQGAFVVATLGVATVALTGTRAAWLGLGAATIFVVIARIGRRHTSNTNRDWKTTLIGAATGVAIGVVGVLINTGVAQRSAGSSSRLAEWGVGSRIVLAHPWLGVGPEGYRTALADGVTAAYEKTYGRTAIPDRAHNVVIDVAAAGGLVAAAMYVTVIAVVVVAAWRIMRSADRQPVVVGFAVATVAYTTQQLFLFPISVIDPIFWMLAGSTMVAVWRSAPIEADRKNRRLARLTVGAIVGVAIFVNGIVALAADRSARVAVDNNDLAAAEQAASLRPDVVRYRLLVASLEPRTITGLNAAVDQTAAALTVSPHDPKVEQSHADALLRLAIATSDQADIDAALAAWQRLVDDDPNCYQCALAFGYASALDGDTDAAIEAFTQAAALAPPDDLEAESVLRALESSDTAKTNPEGGTNDEG